MDADLKAKWTQALRSGKFIQGQGALARIVDDQGTAAFCCLGVLCEVMMEEGYGVIRSIRETRDCTRYTYAFGLDDMPTMGYPTSKTATKAALSIADMEKVANLNDGDRLPFTEIADYIEEHL